MPQAATRLGSFEELGAHYSCVFPVGDEPDPAIVRAIRSICPNYVPLWVARPFRTPSEGIHVAKYHVIGTWQPYHTKGPWPVNVERPYDFKFRGGVVYAQRSWYIPWPAKSWQASVNFPEQGLPYDWDVYWFIKQVYIELKVPFGTRADGDMSGAGRQFNENQGLRRDVDQEALRNVEENARLELRDRISNSPTAKKDFEEWKDAIVNDKPGVLFKVVESKGFRDQIAEKAPEPPAAVAP